MQQQLRAQGSVIHFTRRAFLGGVNTLLLICGEERKRAKSAGMKMNSVRKLAQWFPGKRPTQ